MTFPPDADSTKWYVRTASGETRGAFTSSQLKDFLAAGKISAGTLVSTAPSGPFLPFSQTPNFTPTATTPPPLPPAAASTELNHQSSNRFISMGILLLTALISVVGILVWSNRQTQVAFEAARISSEESVNTGEPTTSISPTLSSEQITRPPLNEGELSPSARAVENPLERQEIAETTARNSEPTVEKYATFEQVVARSEKSVCVIRGEFSTGSGFVFEGDRVMTNRHVISDLLVDEIEVLFPGNAETKNQIMRARVWYEDPKLDVAIIQISGGNFPALDIDKQTKNQFRRGMDVIAIGSPALGSSILENTVSRGLLSSERMIDDIEYYQTSISINPGNSGGPLLGMTGKVVGMITAKGTTVEGIAFSIPAHSLVEIIQLQDRRFQSSEDEHLERINTEHDTRVLVNRVMKLCVFSLVRLENIVDNIFYGIENELEAQDAFEFAIDLDSQVDHSNIDYLESITSPRISKISSSRILQDNVRTKIAELWATYRELRRFTNELRGSANSMRQGFIEFRKKTMRLYDELDALLDLPEISY